MAKYVLLYTGGEQPQGQAEQAAVLKAWTDWFTMLGKAVVDPGNPFSGMVKSIASNGQVSDGPNGTMATGYTIVEADSLDAAVNMAKSCPQLKAKGQISVYETYAVM